MVKATVAWPRRFDVGVGALLLQEFGEQSLGRPLVLAGRMPGLASLAGLRVDPSWTTT